MTAHDLARTECANHSAQGCIAMNIHANLSLSLLHHNQLHTCLLKNRNPCPYFEFTVLPARRHTTDPLRTKLYDHASADYRITITIQSSALATKTPQHPRKTAQNCP